MEALGRKLLPRLEGLWLEARRRAEATGEMAFPHLSCSIPAVAWQLAHLGVRAGFSWVEAPGGPGGTACQGVSMLLSNNPRATALQEQEEAGRGTQEGGPRSLSLDCKCAKGRILFFSFLSLFDCSGS